MLDEVFLEGEGGNRAAGKVIVEAAILHGWPIADGGGVENRLGTRAGDELLGGLGSVEKAPGGGGGDGEGAIRDGDLVAFGAGLLRECGGRLTGELDGEAGTGGLDSAGLERLGEVVGGELVFRVTCLAGDAKTLRDGAVGESVDFAGDGDEGGLGESGGCGKEDEAGGEIAGAHGTTVQE